MFVLFYSPSEALKTARVDEVNVTPPRAGPGRCWQISVRLSELSVGAASPNPSSAF